VSAASAGPGKGSEFAIRLPARAVIDTGRAERTGGEAQRASGAPRTRARRILVVDDNEDAAILLGDMLRSFGHDVRVAYEPLQALAMLSQFEIDVAILDVGLPGMDGYALASRMRAQLGAAVRLIAVTGYGQPQDRARAKQAGFDAHFVKPVSQVQLLNDIEKIGERLGS